jgi:hypothetical protein
MNALQTVLVFGTVVVAGIGPFIAVKRGGDAYGFDDQDEPGPEPDGCDDDTTQIPRVTDKVDPYLY